MLEDDHKRESIRESRIEALESEVDILIKALDEAKEEALSFRKEFTRKRKQIVTLFDTAARLSETDNLKEQLNLVAKGVVRAKLFNRAIISIFTGDFERLDVGYAGLTDEDIRIHKSKPPKPGRLWKKALSDEYRVGNSYFVPHDDPLNIKLSGVKSRLDEKNIHGDWHPSDMLFIPLRNVEGDIIGVMSVDDPCDGHRPTAESLRLPELFAREASALIERSRLLRDLSDAELYLKSLIEASADIIVSTDREGKIVIFNSAAERILGYDSDEIIGKSVTRLYADEDEAHRIMKAMREGRGYVESMEVISVSKSGEKIPISLSATILYDENGEENGTVGISKDLRPIKELQNRILELERKEAVRLVVVTLSHHINNYLQALISRGQNLEELFQTDAIKCYGKETRNEVEKYLTEMKLNAFRVAKLTKALQNPPEDLVVEDYLEGIQMLKLPREMLVNLQSHNHEAMLLGEKHSVLVADDDETIRDGVAEFLRAHGMEVKTAEDGKEAIEKIRNNPDEIEAVVSDIKMPGANGYEVFRAAKEVNPDIEVILMTAFGYDENHALVKASREGLKARIFKEKPLDMNVILNVLTDLFKEKAR